MRVLVFIVSLLIAGAVSAGTLKFTNYLAPNELYPQDLLPLLESYQEGALVSVGTERALMTAILAEKITSIVQIDVDPQVIRYNLINRELLGAAKNREDYLHLRLSAEFKEWQNRAFSNQSLMASSSEHRWWMANFKKDSVGFYDFHRDPKRDEVSTRAKSSKRVFDGAHYLFDDKAFARLHDLALRGRIDVRWVRLEDDLLVWSTLSDIRAAGPISLVDISNTWWKHFAGLSPAYTLSRTLKDIDPDALIVYTDRVQKRRKASEWSYHLGVPGEDGLFADLFRRSEARPSKKYLDSKACSKLLK